ncbi:MAG: response regulator [Sulfuricurvum sp.]|uniref:response regulator transcription factor n=1 Tax=Sulfuricurvum sp. TaxID=2025608 RepID=UPI0025FB4CFC|nr:response regulator [Sulfuricurvum sp.]MBV5320422.1 response regulator [Sulfuricurvum sp.]
MKKVLIVDDVENNRILIRALLENYAEENGYADLEIQEAPNGVEAVRLASQESYELIFMDIMMPEMDGIEATRQIRLKDSKVLLIAVSALDEGAQQREILNNGAEDYIGKPINTEIFSARLSMYDALINSRQTNNVYFNSGRINLFTQEVFSRQLTFFIQNDEQLAEFWEFYLLDQQNSNPKLSAAVRTIYSIGTVAIKSKIKTEVIYEENEDNFYFTMTQIDQIDPRIIRLILLKNSDLSEYKLNETKLSIKIPIEKKSALQTSVANMSGLDTSKSKITGEKTPDNPVKEEYVQKELPLHVYDYMEVDDLDEIKDFISNLDSLMLVVGSGDIHLNEVNEIAYNLERISKTSSLYSESYAISVALGNLAGDIRSHSDEFLQKSSSLGTLCTAFSRDLSIWVRLIFSEGATSVNYMDDTIVSNAQMFRSMLTMDEAEEEVADLDDIFDF